MFFALLLYDNQLTLVVLKLSWVIARFVNEMLFMAFTCTALTGNIIRGMKSMTENVYNSTNYCHQQDEAKPRIYKLPHHK